MLLLETRAHFETLDLLVLAVREIGEAFETDFLV